MTTRTNRTMVAAGLLAMLSFPALKACANDFTMELNLSGVRLQGKPLLYNSEQVLFLSRDGSLHDFHPSQATQLRKVASIFQGLSASEMRGELLREFGSGYEVSGAGRYLVVHPAGERNVWANRFHDLYGSFVRYFSSRGYRADEPEFPLVAVVLPHRKAFESYAAAHGKQASRGLLGYYDPRTNRMICYDITAGDTNSPNWHLNAETLFHEAAHQTAFNTGIHNRFTQQPRWVVEGLGTLFEARGVWDSRQHPKFADRINRYRFERFKELTKSRNRGWLAETVSSERSFTANPEVGYAQSWALTFYLTENQPTQYVRYLERINARDDFKEYPSPNRLQDFTHVFGGNLQVLEARVERFMAGIE